MFIRKFKVSIRRLSVLVLLFAATSRVAYAQVITLWHLENMVDDIVRFILYAAALLMVGFIVLSGIRWISAGSDTAKAQSAKESLKNGIIGAIIILGVGVIVATIEYVVTTGSLR